MTATILPLAIPPRCCERDLPCRARDRLLRPALDALYAALRAHAPGGDVARHPEIDAAFARLLEAAGVERA
jgi:hypothetical protein